MARLLTGLHPARLDADAAEGGGELAGVVLDVADALEVEFGAGEGEAGGGGVEGGRGFRGDGGGELVLAEGEIGEELGPGEAAAGVLIFEVGAAGGVEEGMGLPGLIGEVEAAIDHAERVVGDLPEGVPGDEGVPVVFRALLDALAEHEEGGVELGGEDAVEGVH